MTARYCGVLLALSLLLAATVCIPVIPLSHAQHPRTSVTADIRQIVRFISLDLIMFVRTNANSSRSTARASTAQRNTAPSTSAPKANAKSTETSPPEARPSNITATKAEKATNVTSPTNSSETTASPVFEKEASADAKSDDAKSDGDELEDEKEGEVDEFDGDELGDFRKMSASEMLAEAREQSRKGGFIQVIEWAFVFILVAPGTFPLFGCILLTCATFWRRRLGFVNSVFDAPQMSAANARSQRQNQGSSSRANITDHALIARTRSKTLQGVPDEQEIDVS